MYHLFELLQNITAKRSPNFYNITNSRGKVARFCLFKQAYRLGEDIVGTFDFEQTDVSCIEVSYIYIYYYFMYSVSMSWIIS